MKTNYKKIIRKCVYCKTKFESSWKTYCSKDCWYKDKVEEPNKHKQPTCLLD